LQVYLQNEASNLMHSRPTKLFIRGVDGRMYLETLGTSGQASMHVCLLLFSIWLIYNEEVSGLFSIWLIYNLADLV